MTKLYCTISIFLLLFGCESGNQSKEKQNPISLNQVKQWISYNEQSKKPHIVLVSGDEEYRSEEALPQLAKILSKRHGFKCTVLFAQNPDKPGIINPNFVANIPGLELLETADLMILFTRFRALPDEQMKFIDNYLKAGKPVIGLRTATHAFRFQGVDTTSSYPNYGNFYDGDALWNGGFGRLVLGEKWIAHHGKHGYQSTRGVPAEGAQNHPILNGISNGDIWGPSDVYAVRLPLPGDSKAILLGQVVDPELEFDENDPLLGMRPTDSKLPEMQEKKTNGELITIDQNNPMMPIAWTKSYQLPDGKTGSVFTSTIGASVDLLAEGTRRMIVNAVYWSLSLSVPDKADVQLVGAYNPSRFKFYKEGYWENKNLSIENID